MGRPDVLASFIDEAADRFPAEHYGFTFFDHGGGNTGGYVDTGPPGTQELSVPEMREGMITGMQKAGIDRFDVINQAACLMANYETVSALAPLGKWLAGSEEIMIPTRWPRRRSRRWARAVTAGRRGRASCRATSTCSTASPYSRAARPTATSSRCRWSTATRSRTSTLRWSRSAGPPSRTCPRSPPRWPAPGRRRWSSWPASPDSRAQSLDLVDLGDFMKHSPESRDDVAVARDAVVRGRRPRGHRAGDRPGHPAGTGHQRLPAREPAQREPVRAQRRHRAAGLGASSSRRSSRRRLVPGRQRRGRSVRLVAGADPPGGRVRHQDRRAAHRRLARQRHQRGDLRLHRGRWPAVGARADPPRLPRRGWPGPGAGGVELRPDRADRRADRRAGDGGLPGPVRRPARQLHGAVHLTERRRLRRRRPACCSAARARSRA